MIGKRELLLALQQFVPMSGQRRGKLLRAAGLNVHPEAIVMGSCIITGPQIAIAAGAFINRGCTLDADALITIEERVHLAFGVSVLTASHEMGPPNCRAGRDFALPVTIEAGSWVGAGTMILPGVRIGAGSIIGAGSLVRADIPPHVLAYGRPATPQRPL